MRASSFRRRKEKSSHFNSNNNSNGNSNGNNNGNGNGNGGAKKASPPPPTMMTPTKTPTKASTRAQQMMASPLAIYQSPTVETLDGSLVSARQGYSTPSRQDATRIRLLESTPLTRNVIAAALAAATTPNTTTNHHIATPDVAKKRNTTTTSTTKNHATPNNNDHRATTPPPRASFVTSRSMSRESQRASKRRSRKQQKHRKPRDFQHDEDAMTVTIRKIDVASRTAFEPLRPVSLGEWQRVASLVEETRKVVVSMRKRLSPSMQHLDLLHKMQSQRTIRQISFSPSVGLEADVFVPWNDEMQEENEKHKDANAVAVTESSDHQFLKRRRPRRPNKRDGRYRSIDPLKASKEVLPDVPPMLSNRKHRLPMRSDVGFPNPQPGEIERKQNEIRLETQWEEASPRLIALITSDNLGTAVLEGDDDTSSTELLKWNGGGLPAVPLAGKELLIAKERNEIHFHTKGGYTKPTRMLAPNRTSMLAPPLGASYSSTQGWRPRLFHDRPTSSNYVLACPTSIHFEVGDLEPFVCSLTLYTLPTGPTKKSHHDVYGKSSEDFFFPAGNWEGKVDLDLAKKPSGVFDQDMIESWHQRKHKALFNYDPMQLYGGVASLHLVLQVHKIWQKDASMAPYLLEDDNSVGDGRKKKTIARRIKRKLGKIGKGHGGDNSSKADPNEMGKGRQGLDAVFEKHGTELLTPLCFSVIPLFPGQNPQGDEMKWPKGLSQEMQLYSFPGHPESQERFVERLTKVAMEDRFKSISPTSFWSLPQLESPQSHSSEGTMDCDELLTQDTTESSVEETPKKNRLFKPSIVRRARSASAAISEDKNTKADQHQQQQHTHKRIAGHATVFASFLGMDFTQAMLGEPDPLVNGKKTKGGLPRLLVDVSGDCAIATNTNDQVSALSSSSNTDAKKRSDLVRWPQATTPAGYTEVSEVREMQYLPPKEKPQDVDIPTTFRSVINVLFIYPRVLKLASSSADDMASNSRSGKLKGSKHKDSTYSIRVRLIKCLIGQEEESVEVDEAQGAFYNPAPWSGPQLLKEVYTTVNPNLVHDTNIKREGIPLRDELKIRLPEILEGSVHLEFTLFLVQFVENAGYAMESLASIRIPMSSSSTREASSGVRVTTVIPNGNHRLKLGDWLLQFETRLVSSIHIADPTAATVLRDFPYAKSSTGDSDPERFRALSLAPSRSIVGKSSASADPIVDIKVPYQQLFATSSDSILLGHFPLFVYMHLCNLVNRSNFDLKLIGFLGGENDEDESIPERFLEESQFLMENMSCLFEIIRKVKLKLMARPNSFNSYENNMDHVQYFIKGFVDLFDESFLSNDGVLYDEQIADSATAIAMDLSRSELSREESSEDYTMDNTDGGAVHLRSKDAIRAEVDLRISRTASKISTQGIPFSRIAYGASKIDRMKAEAELNQEGNRFTHLFDDDETVYTAMYTAKDASISGGPPSLVRSGTWGAIDDDATAAENTFMDLGVSKQTPTEPRSFAESGLVKRVRSVAQVMIAPCMAPSLTGLAGTLASPGPSEEKRKQIERTVSTDTILSTKHKEKPKPISTIYRWACPGSDIDESEFDQSAAREAKGFSFRDSWRCPFIPFSFASGDEVSSTTSGLQHSRPFVYEPIMVLWLKAWLDHNGDSFFHGKDEDPLLLPFSSKKLSSTATSPVFAFYAHLDVLLPLCLKSFVLRCDSELTASSTKPKVILDDAHMDVLLPFITMLATSLVGEACSGLADHKSRSLIGTLSSADVVIDFIIGLAAVIHPQQLSELILTYFKTLRDLETLQTTEDGKDVIFVWDSNTLHRVRSSRQLRLHAVERFATMGPFLAINFPLKFPEWKASGKTSRPNWLSQAVGDSEKENDVVEDSVYDDGYHLLPRNGWLADTLVGEALLICSLSCEAVVAEAMAHMESSQHDSHGSNKSLKSRPGKALTREDLLLFQSTAIHAISCVHELIMRRHALDSRFQNEQSRSRIAGLFAKPVIEKSLASVRWLARMESSHKVRALWMLCFIYILQEAPETVLRTLFRSFCYPQEFHIHRFIRLLRLSSSTFQCLVDDTNTGNHSVDPSMSPWLLQESFNSICATIIMVIDECTAPIASYHRELKKMAQGVLDLLLHILTIPQSAVTHLRTVGGALLAMDKLGVSMFMEVVGDNLQHWIRVMLTLMNSLSLSVRSIAVDFVISLLGYAFSLHGNIEEIAITFATVLPEVIGREIALYSVSGLIKDMDQVEMAVWPLRRAFADVEDANPLDDDRVDHQLPPILSVFCRGCQAIIDGVIVELRLQGSSLSIVGTKPRNEPSPKYVFDADEESLFEAANFFPAESSPMQRLRWLQTLARLHMTKGNWVEAAETLMLSARTISDSLPHLKSVWMPSEFALWNDNRRSVWLGTIGKDLGFPDRGNLQVMEFASSFLSPHNLFGEAQTKKDNGKVTQPTVTTMCRMLTTVVKDAVKTYIREDGMNELAFSRLEDLLKVVMVMVDEHSLLTTDLVYLRSVVSRKRHAEEAAALRKALASLNSDLTRIAERLLLVTQEETSNTQRSEAKEEILRRQFYVRVVISGLKPRRFIESTSIPSFLEWNNGCVCRVPQAIVETSMVRGKAGNDSSAKTLHQRICREFAHSLREALAEETDSDGPIMFSTDGSPIPQKNESSVTCLDVSIVHMDNIPGVSDVAATAGARNALACKRFFCQKGIGSSDISSLNLFPPGQPGQQLHFSHASVPSNLVELTVAMPFPCALSRQRTLITSEVVPESA